MLPNPSILFKTWKIEQHYNIAFNTLYRTFFDNNLYAVTADNIVISTEMNNRVEHTSGILLDIVKSYRLKVEK